MKVALAKGTNSDRFYWDGCYGKKYGKTFIKSRIRTICIYKNKSKSRRVVADGAKWVETSKEMTEYANVMITMIGYPSDVEEVYLGEQGLVTNGKPGTYVIDMTTSTAIISSKIYKEAKEKGIAAIDAPVSGGDIGARDAKLSIMVGGARRILKPFDQF